jgi:hypothetical protein
MLSDDPADWRDVILHSPIGDQFRLLPFRGGRPPWVIQLPFDTELLEEFTIGSWEHGTPVYEFIGIVRHP